MQTLHWQSGGDQTIFEAYAGFYVFRMATPGGGGGTLYVEGSGTYLIDFASFGAGEAPLKFAWLETGDVVKFHPASDPNTTYLCATRLAGSDI